jgi:membrane protein DedA with SNARE-associated domain
MVFSLQTLVALELHYRYGFLVPGMIVEGPIVTIIAGFLASQGYLKLWMAYGVAVGADLIGDTLLYALGRFGGRRLIKRYGKYVGVHEARVEKLETHFACHSIKTILLGKLAHGIGAAVLAAAGIAKMPYAKFIGVNLAGTLVKSLILILVGFYFGRAYETANSYLNTVALGGLLLVVVILLVYFVPKQISKLLKK